jgi:hypothetical protein
MIQERYDQEQASVTGNSAPQTSNVTYLRDHQKTGTASANLSYQGEELVLLKIETPPSSSNAKGNKMPDLTREEIDAKLAASEARTDTKIARLEGKLDLVLSKLDDVRNDNRGIRANQWVIGFGLALLIVAIAALFPAFFGIGAQVKDLVDASVQSHLHPSQK